MNKGLWIHASAKDMFIEVLSCLKTEEGFKVRFRCWNKGQSQGEGLITHEIFSASISEDQASNWRPYVVPN